jgi:hypothetical protein
MNDRIHDVLDGELPRARLTDAEGAELAAAEADIAAVLAALPTAPLPDLARAVLSRIPQPARAPARSLLAWLWRPRPIAIGWRPAYGLAVAALLVLFVGLGRRGPAAHPAHQVLTQFVLDAPAARQVMLAGDFTGWQPAHALTRSGTGVWTVVVPLDPGVHSYQFVVDGERWIPDPNAPAVDDGFGGMNSRLAVLAPDEVQL